MRMVAICGSGVRALLPNNPTIESITIHGLPTLCGVISQRDLAFDPLAPQWSKSALVRVLAFSCNYRDLTLVLEAIRQGASNSFFVVGSEFVGKVLAVGPEVTRLRIGDRVIGNNHYTRFDGFEGVPTSSASRELQIMHEDKLIKVPEAMPDSVAAAFSIGAQTAYSMIRKAQLAERSRVLVLSGGSNTSLFLLNALKRRPLELCAATGSPGHREQLRALGVPEVLVLPGSGQAGSASPLQTLVAEDGPFDCVFDPFFDLHLAAAIELIAPGGRYITCGLLGQHQDIDSSAARSGAADMRAVLTRAIMNNIAIIGNNLGVTDDLAAALDDYTGGRLDVVLDSVHTGPATGAFFDRLFNARERFGKVVYAYAQSL